MMVGWWVLEGRTLTERDGINGSGRPGQAELR